MLRGHTHQESNLTPLSTTFHEARQARHFMKYVKYAILCDNCDKKINLNRLILAHININSIRSKLDMLASQVKGNVDVIMIAERKLDYIFLVY